MGANECKWVWMGAMWYMRTGGQKINATIVKNGRKGYGFGSMAGEISPNITFGESRCEGTRMVVGACKWVGIGDYGCISNGRIKNKTKRAPNG